MKSVLGIVFLVVVLGSGISWGMSHGQGNSAGQEATVKSMVIVGEIDQMNQGYIIRGEKPAEIFTILNPQPEVLDDYVNKGKTVTLDVRIVSGDNVEIQKINHKDY